MRTLCLLALAGCMALSAAPARGQATRTWVSGTGDDVNPCSLTAPCKTFAGAISKTAAGGEISVLTPGGFGTVTITKSITIDGQGTIGSILASTTNGIIVNAGASDRITLRNLSINGTAPTATTDGIRVLQAAAVHVDGCTVERFGRAGIAVLDDALVTVRDVTFVDTGSNGLLVAAAAGTARVLVDDSAIERATTGVNAGAGGLVVLRHTSIVGGETGVLADGAATEVSLDDATLAYNVTGARATGGALVRTSRALVVANTGAGLVEDGGGRIVPFLENQVAGNPPGAATTCELTSLAGSVACPAACPDVSVPACPTPPACPEVPACPAAPACPAPVCESPVMVSKLGPCKRCKTRNGTTTCTGCGIDAQ